MVCAVPCIPQDSFSGPFAFFVVQRDLPSLLESVFVGYADDSTLVACVPSSRDRIR